MAVYMANLAFYISYFAVDVNCQIVCLLSINPFSDMMACYLIFVPIHVFRKTLDFNV